jgi:hypothetical protein
MIFIFLYATNTVCAESRYAVIKCVESDVHERLYKLVSILAPLLRGKSENKVPYFIATK